jgi:dienelactone hydrolase
MGRSDFFVSRPGIDLVAAPRSAADLVLLAHGGEVDSLGDPHSWRAPILRMWPFAAAVRDAAPDAAVGLMRYRYRGWNGADAHPAADLRAVLDGLPERIKRVVLIGHSLGGRAVVAAGNHSKVVGVLGLAPWLPADEPITLHGSGHAAADDNEIGSAVTVVLAHGTDDRITDPRLTAAYARRLRATSLTVGLVNVEGENHAMLRRYADWNELVRRFTLHALGEPVDSARCPVLSTEPDRTDLLPRWNRPGGSLAAGVRDIVTARLQLRVLDHL